MNIKDQIELEDLRQDDINYTTYQKDYGYKLNKKTERKDKRNKKHEYRAFTKDEAVFLDWMGTSGGVYL